MVYRCGLSILIAATLIGCTSTAPPKRTGGGGTAYQQVNFTQLEKKVVVVDGDKKVVDYINQLGKRLAGRSKVGGGIRVKLTETHRGKWWNFSFPRKNIYLSRDLVKRIEFENEIAALIGLEIAHLELNHVQRRRVGGSKGDSGLFGIIGLFSGGGDKNRSVKNITLDTVFDYSPEEMRESVKRCVEILYRSNYDPRGLVAVWEKIRNSSFASFDESDVKLYEDETRSSIARLTPLRNPVVQSREFIVVQKRFDKL